jgi:hypothetical protein
MQLDSHDLHLFFKLYPALLCFVNQRLGVVEKPLARPEKVIKLPTEDRIKLRDALVANMDLIDAFVSENPFKLPEDELAIVRSWKDLVAGEFYVYRCLTKYTIFLSVGEPVVAYGVLSLMDPSRISSVIDSRTCARRSSCRSRDESSTTECSQAITSGSGAGFAGGSRSPMTTPRNGGGSSRPSHRPPMILSRPGRNPPTRQGDESQDQGWHDHDLGGCTPGA